MTPYVLIVGLLVIVVLLAVMLSNGHTQNVSADLRALLVAQAEGKITAEEFNQRQAALHAALLTPSARNLSLRSLALPAIIAVAVIAAAGFYFLRGSPKASDLTQGALITAMPSSSQIKPAARTGGDMNEMVKRLADKLAKDPSYGEGWALLGHSYIEVHQYAEATTAFARAAAILPPNAALLADWADAYVMSHERKWDKESRDIVKRALAADPRHLKTLALAGSEAFDRGEYKEAIAYWNRMKAAAPANSMDAKLADANIQEATTRMTGKPPISTGTGVPAASSSTFTTVR